MYPARVTPIAYHSPRLRLLRWLLAASVLALTGGCGHRSPASAPPSPLADGERDYPALRWISADASYAVVAARTTDLATAFRELLHSFELLGLVNLERELTRALVLDPLAPNDLARAGISLERSAALFSGGIYPTFLLPIADGNALAEALDARRPGHDVTVRHYRGYDVFSYQPEEEIAIRWLVMDDWLLAHIGGPGDSELGWLDHVLETPAGRGLGAAADFADARAKVAGRLPAAVVDEPGAAWFADHGRRPVHPSVVGLVRLDRVRAGLAATLSAVGEEMPEEISACLAGFPAGAVGFLGAQLGWNRADGVIGLPLQPALADQLGAAASPAPPAGYQRFRAEAGIAVDLALNLGWLRQARDTSGCYLVLPMRATDRLVERAGGSAVTGYHLAGSDFGAVLGQGSSARAALYLVLSEPGFAEALLDLIPQRRLLEKQRRVNGVEVQVIALPLMPEVAYRLQPTSFTASLGDGLVGELFPPAEGQAPGGQPAAIPLASFAIYPGRLQSSGDVIRAIASTVFDMSSRLDSVITGLGRYEYGRVGISLQGRDLIVDGTARLRR